MPTRLRVRSILSVPRIPNYHVCQYWRVSKKRRATNDRIDRLLVGAGLISVIAITLAAFLVLPELRQFVPGGLTADQRVVAQNAIRDSGLKVAAGVGAVIAGLLAYRRYELSKSEHVLARRTNSDEQLSKAIEQLGSTSSATRLGGIHVLRRLASESEEYLSSVIELLLAYCRAESERYHVETRTDSPEDILAAVTFLAQLRIEARLGRLMAPGLILDGGSLARWDLHGANLQGVQLNDVDASECDLAGANLLGAVIRGADLRRCSIANASLPSARLISTNLSHIDGRGAALRLATLLNCDLTHSRFSSSNWTMATLRSCLAENTSFSEAVLVGTHISQCNLTGASFGNARLTASTIQSSPIADEYLVDAETLATQFID